MQVKALRTLTASALTGAVLIWGGRLLAGSDATGAGELEMNPAVHLAIAYAISLLAFAACPATRRGDLAKVCFTSGALLCLIRAVSWRENMTAAVIGEALGVTAAVLPSGLERFRSALRAEPGAQVSMRHPAERRTRMRLRRTPVFARQEVSQA